MSLSANTNSRIAQSALGKPTAYADRYDPGLLYPIERAPNRALLWAPEAPLPFVGADLWTAYELSWLNTKGKPQIAIAHFTIPCETPCMVESKSFKLYLNSWQLTRVGDVAELRERIRADVSAAVWGVAPGSALPGPAVGLQLRLPDAFGQEGFAELEGFDLDRLDIECSDLDTEPQAAWLWADTSQAQVSERLVSNLLKSNCPVTNQPDWGSIQIDYSGHAIDQASLLRYIVAFRHHQDFHEHCCERIFADIWQRCQPTKLAIYTRYTRRGGLDINPYRTSHPRALPSLRRTARQ